MATTLQNIISTLRGSGILPVSQINYGITDKLAPPYLSVQEYEHEYAYQTGAGCKFKHSKFKLLIVSSSQDSAEGIAEQVDNLLNLSRTLTPNCDRVFQEHYRVGQLEFNPTLYQFGVEIAYSMTENL